MATINNSTNNTIVSATASADSIWNKADNVHVNAGGGNDTIRNGFEYTHDYDNSYVVINAGNGNDEIWNTDSYVTINSGKGDDSIDFSGGHIKAYGGAGNDTVTFWCAEENDSLLTDNYLDGGEGDNVIRTWNGGHNFTINTGSGNDDIGDYGADNSIINAGEGNNNVIIAERWLNGSFVSRAEKILVNTGSGHDSIGVYGADKSTINAGAGCDKIWNNGSNNIVNLGAGNDFAVNDYWSESYVVINGESGNDLLFNHGRCSTINGGADNDTIYGTGGINTFLNGEAGNDVIVSGHSGPNYVEHYETYNEESEHVDVTTLVADTSDRAITVSNVTIKGGKGNDTIAIGSKASKQVVQYASGDGNDIVYGYTAADTIHITSGEYTTQNSSNDVIIKVGSGSVKLKNTKGVKLNIKGTYGGSSSTTKISTLNITNSYNSPITIDSGVETVDASKRTTAVRITGNSLANSIKGGKSDNTLIGGEGNDTLTGGSGNNVFQYASGDGNDVITNYSGNDTIEITDGVYSTQNSGNDVIVKVGSGSISLKNAKGTTLNIIGTISNKVSIPSDSVTYNGHSYKLYTVGKTWDEAKTYCENLGGHLVAINTSGEQSIVENMIRDGSKSSYWLGGYKNSAGDWNWVTNEPFAYSNWAIGEPNNAEEAEDKLMIFKNPDPKNPEANFGDWNDLAADCAEGAYPATIYGKSSFGFICEWDTVSSSSISVTLTNSDSSPYTASSNIKNINASSRTTAVKIKGNSLSNSIVGGSGDDSLSGGADADTLNGSKGNDTLIGGAGNDVFIYQSGQGNDVISDYAAGQDKIIISSDFTSSLNDSNVILKVGNGSIKINNGVKKLISITDSDGNVASLLYGSKAKDTLIGSNSKDSIYGNDGNDLIDGGKGADFIEGGVGADTIIGGKGKDTLSGGKGKNVFIYNNGDGKDTITDYKSTDSLQINGSYSTQVSGQDVIIKVGSGSITLKNAINEKLNIDTSLNYVEENWFNADDDFLTNELDSIIEVSNSEFSIVDTLSTLASKTKSYDVSFLNSVASVIK